LGKVFPIPPIPLRMAQLFYSQEMLKNIPEDQNQELLLEDIRDPAGNENA
tara:strand:- start:305 stop:454 length:150 start_codon:yes stop_codon:yes gene_type:complete